MSKAVFFILFLWAGARIWASDAYFSAWSSCDVRVLKTQTTVIPFSLESKEGLTEFLSRVRELLEPSQEKNNQTGWMTKRGRRAWKGILRSGESALTASGSAEREEALRRLLEFVAAANNNHRNPAPPRLDFLQVPWMFLDHLYAPVAMGRRPANNLQKPGRDPDGLVDPIASSFWRRPVNVAHQDLYLGFGRGESLHLEGILWRYHKPKDSFGGNAGYEVRSGEIELKIKFGEIHSEPFTSRIFHALGYHVDPTDYSPGLNVLYDRNLFREFNSRRPIRTRFYVLGIVPVYELDLQKKYDPFEFIAWAQLSDGSRISGDLLRTNLLKEPTLAVEHIEHWEFKEPFEARISFLRTKPANVQLDDPQVKSVGPWDFGQLGHEHQREVRGAGLLAAWLGWCDSRFENTRLKVVTHGEKTEVRHYFSDVGGGLGRSAGLVSWGGELPNQFPWTFTRPWPRRPGDMPHPPFRVVHFRPIEDTPAFRFMTLGDARWMARMIAQITESQLTAALIASGFDSAETKLYTEKLICRRDKLIADLGLAEELGFLRPDLANRKFNFNPLEEGRVSTALPNGHRVHAPITRSIISRGRLVERSDASPSSKHNASFSVQEPPKIEPRNL